MEEMKETPRRRTKLPRHLLLVVGCVLLSHPACTASPFPANVIRDWVAMGDLELSKAVGVSPGQVMSIQPIDGRQSLAVFVLSPSTSHTRAWVRLSGDQASSQTSLPGLVNYLTDDGKVALYSIGPRNSFLRNDADPPIEGDKVGMDHAGNYFFVVRGGRTEVFRFVDRKKIAVVDLRTDALFVRSPKAWLVGRTQGQREGELSIATLEDLEGAPITRLSELAPRGPWGRVDVVDFDETAELLVVRGRCDLPCKSRWLSYDMASHEFGDLGAVNDFGAFLRGATRDKLLAVR